MEEIRYEAYDVAWKILGNEKRLEKLRKIADSNAWLYVKYEKVNNIITAVCREQKIKLSDDEYGVTMRFLLERLERRGIVFYV